MLREQPRLLEGPLAPKATNQVCSHPGAAEMGQKRTQSYFMNRETQPSWRLGLNILRGGAWGWWRPQVRLLGAVKAQKCPQGYLAPGMSAKAPFCGKSCLLAGQESAWAYKNWKSAWEAFPPALKATKTSAKEWHPLGFVSPMVRAGGGPVLQDILTR